MRCSTSATRSPTRSNRLPGTAVVTTSARRSPWAWWWNPGWRNILDWIDAAATTRVQSLVKRYGHPVSAPELNQDALIEAMTGTRRIEGEKSGSSCPVRSATSNSPTSPSEAEVRQARRIGFTRLTP